jgi:hypothetical protein
MIYNVTDLINAVPDNNSVNTLHYATIERLFCMGVFAAAVAMQRCGKRVSTIELWYLCGICVVCVAAI